MPRTRPLIPAQAVAYETIALSNAIREKIQVQKTLKNLTGEEVALKMGISKTVFYKIMREGFLDARFHVVMKAVNFAGYELKLVKRSTQRPDKNASSKNDDIYGASIEQLIRQIVLETVEQQK